MALTLRLEKGSSLTHQELDDNFRFFFYSASYNQNTSELEMYKYEAGSPSATIPFSSNAVGVEGSVQFKHGTSLTGSGDFVYDYTNQELTVTGSVFLSSYLEAGSKNLIVSSSLLKIGSRIDQTGLGESTYFGFEAGSADDLNTRRNTGFGYQVLLANVIGTDNVGIGYQVLHNNISGSNNIAFGSSALYSNSAGANNIGIGSSALKSMLTGSQNIMIGTSAGATTQYANYNIGIGVNTLRFLTTGDSNVGVGTNAMYYNTVGYKNVGVGNASLYNNANGNYNTTVGDESLLGNTAGSYNTALGTLAGTYLLDGVTFHTTGSNNLYLGSSTKARTGGTTNETVIGYNAIGNGTNTVTLGNTVVTAVYSSGSYISKATSANLIPAGSIGQRPGTPVDGMFRYNTTSGSFEGYQSGSWQLFSTGGSVDLSNYARKDIAQSITGSWSFEKSVYITPSLEISTTNSTIGSGSIVAGTTAIGTDGIKATGIGSFAHGFSVTGVVQATADGAAAQGEAANGQEISATGTGAFAMGYSNVISSSVIASGVGSFAGGSGAIAPYDNMFAFGVANTGNHQVTGDGTNPILQLGNGYLGGNPANSWRSNAFEVKVSGNVYASGSYNTTATSANLVPAGTVAQRPGTPVEGMLRYDSDARIFEGYASGSWKHFVMQEAGAWTPTFSNLTNITSPVSMTGYYVKTGNIVHANVTCNFAITAAGQSELDISLPYRPAVTTHRGTVSVVEGAGLYDVGSAQAYAVGKSVRCSFLAQGSSGYATLNADVLYQIQ